MHIEEYLVQKYTNYCMRIHDFEKSWLDRQFIKEKLEHDSEQLEECDIIQELINEYKHCTVCQRIHT